MGWQERDYASADGYAHATGRRPPLVRLDTVRVSTILIIVNVSVLVLDSFFPLFEWGAMFTPAVKTGQVWRLITSQYLHAGTMHLFFNMLGLYFLGRYLEQHWGRRKFFIFYTACGLAGNLFYLCTNLLHWLPELPAIGASGCILGVLGACAVLFPGIQLIIYFFPMKIRTAAVLFLGLYVLNLINRGGNAGGDAAHLAGLVVGAGYAFWRRGPTSQIGVRRVVAKVITTKRPASPWRRKMKDEERMNNEVDQVLAKINDHGVGSLTAREKRLLAEASQRQQARDEELGRTDRL